LSSDPQAQFDHIVDRLNALGMASIHVVEEVLSRKSQRKASRREEELID